MKIPLLQRLWTATTGSKQEEIITLFNKTAKIEQFSYNGNIYDIYVIPREIWSRELVNLIHGRLRLRVRLTRGIAWGKRVYIREAVGLGRDKLIIHEVGHTLGFGHTWKPTIMNPTWLFRWFNRM